MTTTTFGLPEARPLALVGEAFRLLGSPLKRTAPTVARGRCPQKIKIALSLIKGTDDDHGNGSIGDKPPALAGEVSLTVNGVGSSERRPLSPVGAADKLKLFFHLFFCGQRPQASVGAVRLSRHRDCLSQTPTNAGGLSSGGLVK
ncbi:MAG: hypothetical protein MPL62_08105 [Alphaproteobacteria bacterium]|nr:hypothetical protein [Alphaproteobacteria bacterium]